MRVLCSSRKPMRKTPVSGFPRALLSLSHARKRRALASRLYRTVHAKSSWFVNFRSKAISCPSLNLIVLRLSDFKIIRKKWRRGTIRQRREAKVKNISRVERTTFWPPNDLNNADLSMNDGGPYPTHFFQTLLWLPFSSSLLVQCFVVDRLNLCIE